MYDFFHQLRQDPKYRAQEEERDARERERKTQLLATKSSQGYKSSLQSEKEEILKFFKANNYRQLFPGRNKFKSGSFYYVIDETGPDNDSYLAPIKKRCVNVENGGLKCSLRDVKGLSLDIPKDLTRDEVYEKTGYFGKSATNDWKRPANYKDKFANNAAMAESAPVMALSPTAPNLFEPADTAEPARKFESFEITTGGKRKTRKRRHSVRKSRKHRKKSHKKQRKSRRK
jgi:hypothetical protein